MKTIILKSKIGVFALLLLFVMGCSEDDGPNIIGKTNHADFSYEIDEDDPLTVHFTNESQEYHSSYWRFGDGSEFTTEESPSHTFPYGGTFDVILAVEGDNGGGEIMKEVGLESDNPWSIDGAGQDNLGEVQFLENGDFVITEGDESTFAVVVWQEIEVEPGVEYQFSANVAGAEMENAWVEVHLSHQEPDGEEDYIANNLWSLNVWADCGIEPFDADIVELSCHGEGNSEGTYTFDEGGTAYMVIKAGSADGGLGPDGITFTDVTLEPIE